MFKLVDAVQFNLVDTVQFNLVDTVWSLVSIDRTISRHTQTLVELFLFCGRNNHLKCVTITLIYKCKIYIIGLRGNARLGKVGIEDCPENTMAYSAVATGFNFPSNYKWRIVTDGN